ncbi:MAG: MBOAT family O-acyltransferase [Mucinivorans sp.]
METIDKLLALLQYNPNEPLIFSSGMFLFLFLGFTLFYSLFTKRTLPRIIYVTVFSLYFYYKTSGIFFLLLLCTATSDFSIGLLMSRASTEARRKFFVALSVAINVGMLCYFKYTNFFIDIYNDFTDNPLDFQNIFLPIGISFFTFQSMSYTIDIYRRRIEPLTRWVDYVFFVSFFPQLVAGPIVRARDFIPQIRRNPIVISRDDFARGVFLILTGLFKKCVISDFISINFVDRIFDAPMLYTGFENLMGVYGYGLQIYCDFAGYSDMAIGIALLLGFHFLPNFNSPYKSATITEFWRRWHISLSSWLKDYIYVSLGGNRRGKVRQYLNLMLTMLIGGLWHGASLRFLLWGAMHGAALAVHKVAITFLGFKAQGENMTSRWRRVLGIFITFNFVSFAWIFFRAGDMETAWGVITQIFTYFHPEIFLDFVAGYRWVFLVIVVGYLLHFASAKSEARSLALFTSCPLWSYPFFVAALVWFIMQISSGEVQPFIYFQF